MTAGKGVVAVTAPDQVITGAALDMIRAGISG